MGSRNRNLVSAVLLLSGMATTATAEVMDKFPAIGVVWQWSIPLAIVAFAVGRVHPLLGIGLLFLPNVPLNMLFAVMNSIMGPAIRSEAGTGYVAQVYSANALWLVSYLGGALLWLLARRRKVHRYSDPTG